MNDLFVSASRQAWRFPSTRGELTTEQLWGMPLLAKNGFDLNSVARALNQAVKELGEESFVDTRSNPERSVAEGKLELVKSIISVRQAENAAAEQRAHRAVERARILDALAARESEELTKSSKDELLARLAQLDA
jgi:hypothetical protein